jgi:hypothetical protein
MPTFKSVKTRSKTQSRHLAWTIFFVITSVIISVIITVVLASIWPESEELISMAKAHEARSSLMPATTQQSWSDEWYETHKAIRNSVAEEIQGF